MIRVLIILCCAFFKAFGVCVSFQLLAYIVTQENIKDKIFENS